MNQRKPNRIMRYSLVLVLLLCAGVLVMSTGTAFARYRSELRKDVTFEVKPPADVTLGTLVDGTFTDAVPPTIAEDNTLLLAIANGTEDADCSSQAQTVSLRMAASAGIGSGAKISLTQGESTWVGTAEVIGSGSSLYNTFGDGWLYTFLDKDGNELSWTLPGGEFAYVSMTVSIEAATLENVLLRPIVIGELADNG